MVIAGVRQGTHDLEEERGGLRKEETKKVLGRDAWAVCRERKAL